MRPAPALLAALLALSACTHAEEIRRTSVLDERMAVPVQPGMAPETVLKLIGTPTRIAKADDVVWYYAAQSPQQEAPEKDDTEARRRLVAVIFGPNRKVERVAFYVKADGRIIDVQTQAEAEEVSAEVWRSLYEKDRP